MRPRKETVKGRKAPATDQLNAITIFFMPVMSFSRKFDISMLYMIPIPKGKRIIKTAKGFCKKDNDKAVK